MAFVRKLHGKRLYADTSTNRRKSIKLEIIRVK
jgi:hypothetical protein